MGYQNIGIDKGFSFFTVTFEDVGVKETYNLSDIKCVRVDGGAWTRTGFGTAAANACSGAIYLRKVDASGAYGQKYTYYGKNTADTFGPGWYVGDRMTDGSNLVQGDDVTLAAGEGVIVYCSKDAGAQFVVSGGVNLKETTVDVGSGFSFGGNCTPVPITLSQIKCLRADGEDWTRTGFGTAAANACSGAIYLRKISADGAYGQKYTYYGKNTADTFGPGWYVGDRKTDGSNLVTADNDIPFEPGEGWILYSSKTAAKIVVPKPITE